MCPVGESSDLLELVVAGWQERGVERVVVGAPAERAAPALARLQEEVPGLPLISLECGDLLLTKVSDADVIFAFATCFPPDLMAALVAKLELEMKLKLKLELKLKLKLKLMLKRKLR